MKKNKNTILALLLLTSCGLSAQIQMNGGAQTTTFGSSSFLNASRSFSSASVGTPSLSNNSGKGLVFSDTDLTTFL